jgi:hypothetical protein
MSRIMMAKRGVMVEYIYQLVWYNMAWYIGNVNQLIHSG